MRVALIGYANDIHVVRWCNALQSRGIDLHLITIHRPDGKNPLHPGVIVHVLPHHRGLGYLTGISSLRRLISRLRPDIINTHYAEGYGTMARLARIHPNILSVYGHDVFEAPYRNAWYRRIITDNLRQADHIASTSHVMKSQVFRLVPSAEVSVTPFGVDTRVFTPKESAKKSSFVIGTVKKLDYKYGVDTLIRGFAIMRERCPGQDLRLEITGNGPRKDDLIQLTESLQITPYVTFFPAVPHAQVPDQLHRLDLYVAASRSHGESFGVAIIEAMACGIPVVVSTVGGLPEVTQNGRFGQLVPPENPEALATALCEQYAESAEMRQSTAEKARLHVMQTYSWDTCVDTMIDLYTRISAKSGDAPHTMH
jgi:L-malate glycosyltransferase